jgi:hypothetical protein
LTQIFSQFKDLLYKFSDVFSPDLTGYNGAIDPFEASVNMGPVQPQQRKGRMPQSGRRKTLLYSSSSNLFWSSTNLSFEYCGILSLGCGVGQGPCSQMPQVGILLRYNPGCYGEYDVPANIEPNSVLTMEPHDASQRENWPNPQITECVIWPIFSLRSVMGFHRENGIRLNVRRYIIFAITTWPNN